MERRNTLNGLLLAAVVALGALAWLGPPSDDGSVRARLTALSPEKVRTLEIEYPPEAVEGPDTLDRLALERHKDGWYLTHPIERPARDGRIVTALQSLTTLSDACYALREHDPADFGLAQPLLRLHVGKKELAFGKRSADGRRYVQSGIRMCLLQDQAYPLLAQGLSGLAAPALLTAGAEPLRIESPWARAARPDTASDWSVSGEDAATSREVHDWSARWLAAQAEGFVLAPPAADHGRIRLQTADGEIHQWRIARMPPELVLVPDGADYGIRIAESRAAALLHPAPPGTSATRPAQR